MEYLFLNGIPVVGIPSIKVSNCSDGILIVWVPARPHRRRPCFPPWYLCIFLFFLFFLAILIVFFFDWHFVKPCFPPWHQCSSRRHHQHQGENNKASIIIIVIVVLTSVILTMATRLIMIDAFRYAGRALGVQLGAHIKTQVLWFPESFLQQSRRLFFSGSSVAFSIQCPSKVGWSAIFGLNFCLIVANLLYIGFAVVDKKKPVQDGTSGDYSKCKISEIWKNASGCWKVTTSLLSSYPSLISRWPWSFSFS